ncbi:MAG: cytidylate kinase family protein [Nanoarchaeota archaeon]|nr:cytidylate kinase family protein [Nanoarchaeota archaeon]
MIITISGTIGSGKSSVGILVAKKLGFKYYCIGDLRREMAKKRGISIWELNKLGEEDPSTDLEPDKFAEEKGKKEDNFVMVGRTSFHFIPHSVKIFLDVAPEVGAKRIFNHQRNEEKYKDLKQAIKKANERHKSDDKRYKKYYNLDVFGMSNYDFVIDTTNLTIEQAAEKIIEKIR